MVFSLRASVVAVVCLLFGALTVVGAIAVTASIHSAQQASTFQEKSLIPVVGLSSMSQNVDQERDLLSKNIAQMNPDRRRAVQDELRSLDIGITATASRVLLAPSRPLWTAAWGRYVAVRTEWLQALVHRPHTPIPAAEREGLSNRLDTVIDVLQRDAGIRLYEGQRRYTTTVQDDWTMIRIAVVVVGLTLMLGFLFGVVIIRRLRVGLRNLVLTAEAITVGKLEVRAETGGGDELSVVARAFNHMTDVLLQLEKTALTDPLTGLGNHRGFHEEFGRELARAIRHGHPLSLALVDVDDFKSVNDNNGHAHGDRVLADLAVCLRQTRLEDRPFRIGGDEFAILLPYAAEAEAMAVLERLRTRVETALPSLTVSIGVAALHSGIEDGETLREQADAALYESKRRGRNTLVSFEVIKEQALIVSPARMQLVRDLMAQRQIGVAFQPIWSLERGAILGYEALMRPLPESGLGNPQEVFDIAEKLGRATELDHLCLQAILGRAGELPPGVLLFVNLSPQSLEFGALKSAAILQMVADAGLTPDRIVFEITERSVARVDMVVREAKRLQELGFQLALDDVGAGNAGLDMLRQVSVDFVKIDRTVIGQALIDEGAAAVLSGIIAFARRAHTYVIAEGIETQAMLDIIRQAGLPDPTTEGGVQGVQGYLLGRPSESIVTSTPVHGLVVSYGDFKARQRAAALTHPAGVDHVS